MTPDTLRTGAALVRALVEGDETARGPLADWIEWHGHPGYGTGAFLPELICLLRDGRPISPFAHVDRKVIGLENYATANGTAAWLGRWPMWAWDGGYPDDGAATDKQLAGAGKVLSSAGPKATQRATTIPQFGENPK